jgi:hypothetical protein
MKLCAACAVVFVVATAGPEAQSPDREVLLRRAADYLVTFVEGLSNVVAEEEYQQSFREGAGRRRLKSDFLLVLYPGDDNNFLAFRDVIEVNGRPVTDQQDRLLKLFVEPYKDPLVRASEIASASAGHSIARGRLVNPLFVIALLQRHYQPRFRFSLKDLEPKLGPDVREIELFESVAPKPSGPQPIHAVAWVNEITGRVVRTELRAGKAPSTALLTTTFGTDPVLGVDVPLEMRDLYLVGATGSSALATADEYIGVAKYTRFRRFQVHVAETIDTPSRR